MLIGSSSLLQGLRRRGVRGASSGNRLAISRAISYFVNAPDWANAIRTCALETACDLVLLSEASTKIFCINTQFRGERRQSFAMQGIDANFHPADCAGRTLLLWNTCSNRRIERTDECLSPRYGSPT